MTINRRAGPTRDVGLAMTELVSAVGEGAGRSMVANTVAMGQEEIVGVTILRESLDVFGRIDRTSFDDDSRFRYVP